MSLWFCRSHALAGTAADVVCCSSTLLVACESDASIWYRIRLAMKPDSVRAEIATWRWRDLRATLVDAALRAGKGWTISAARVAEGSE